MFLVLIETSGNQNYIFSTNRLRENIGASELTYQAGTYWVGEAVDKHNSQKFFQDCRSPEAFRKALEGQVILQDSGQQAEIIVAASGKALILTKDEETAREIIAEVTRRALIEAPGLDLAGVYEPFTWSDKNADTIADAVKKVHRTFEDMRSHRPSPNNRFLRLPIVASCAVSGLPASQIDRDPRNRPQLISQVSYNKRQIAEKGTERLQSIAKSHKLAMHINELEKVFDSDNMPWVAIVHADGNGLGQIFLNFKDLLGDDKSSRSYIAKYRKFSLTLDECTEGAFRSALDQLPLEDKEKAFLPIVPLIIGGDDLTLVCHGQYALEFTRIFLQKFEEKTQSKKDIADIAQGAFSGINRLSACAGIAIVKRHFPFSSAYQLAESLIKSAKEVKRKVTIPNDEKTPFPCSAIDFHILYDSTGTELQAVRKQLEPQDNVRLYNRPYVVSTDLGQAKHKDWIEWHRWHQLSNRVKQLKRSHEFREIDSDSDLTPISSAQSHALRSALFLGKPEADAAYQLIQQRYDLTGFVEDIDSGSLFHKEPDEEFYTTSFLDALDAMEFLEKAQPKEPNVAKSAVGVTP